ncbi:unnamed protein product [Thlaspi arvense]|uniref:Uncharacterized protein n=1 Tax=Thlaspi arvense TaxID=13288 RepID=A0AAU9S4M0_THLAR|nr:unnamed protein product [Thlaspi arvense]
MLIPQIPSLLLLREKKFTTRGLLPPRGIAPSAFAHCGKFPTAASRRSLGRVSVSPSVADHPLGPATDHRLGKLLPHQLANQTRAPPRADSSFCSSAYGLKEVDLLASLMVQSSSRRAPFLLGPQRQNVGLMPTVHHGRKDSDIPVKSKQGVLFAAIESEVKISTPGEGAVFARCSRIQMRQLGWRGSFAKVGESNLLLLWE